VSRASLKEIRPDLIVCSVTPFGDSGPYADAAGPDLVLEAISGFLGAGGQAPGSFHGIRAPLGDVVAGLYAALGVTAAIHGKGQEDGGAYLEVSAMEGLVSLLGPVMQDVLLRGVPREEEASAGTVAPAGVFQTQDRPLAIVANSDQAWRQLCAAVGKDDLADDPRFLSGQDRASHQKDLRALLEAELRRRPAAEWIEDLRERAVPVGPVNVPEDLVRDPHIEERQGIATYTHALLENMRMLRCPIRIQGASGRMARAAPLLGEHNREVYRDLLGYKETELKRLRSEKVI
jgi:crotonobetainyl-CoA:carnitine CoA-transferase CaiB-like acyl-CoA transferase